MEIKTLIRQYGHATYYYEYYSHPNGFRMPHRVTEAYKTNGDKILKGFSKHGIMIGIFLRG